MSEAYQQNQNQGEIYNAEQLSMTININNYNRFYGHAGLDNPKTSSPEKNYLSPQTKNFLVEFLLQLDFEEQLTLVETCQKHHQTLAFLVYGQSERVRKLLINRLLRIKPQWKESPPKIVDFSSISGGYNLRSIWARIAEYYEMDKSIKTISENIFEAILEQLNNQDVIFIFDSIEYLRWNKTLELWLQNFWLPLVERVHQYHSKKDTHLLMFLVDNDQEVDQSKIILTEQFNPLIYHPHIPLNLSPPEKFTLDKIENWLKLVNCFKSLSIPVDLTAQYLWENSGNGKPEYVFKLICKNCNLKWEGELREWLI